MLMLFAVVKIRKFLKLNNTFSSSKLSNFLNNASSVYAQIFVPNVGYCLLFIIVFCYYFISELVYVEIWVPWKVVPMCLSVSKHKGGRLLPLYFTL
jgi:hypothetical protein